MEGIAKLNVLKRTHQSHLGRAINSLEEELNDENGHGVDPTSLRKYVESVDLKFQKVEEDSNKLLEAYKTEDEIEKEITELDSLQEKVTNVKVRAIEALDAIKEIKEDEKRNGLVEEMIPPMYREDRPRTPKLPDLQIETFKGDLEKYPEFMDAFTATIDNNTKLDAVDKFRYLRMYLEDVKEDDGPKSLIKGFSMTADNYQLSLQIIKETYSKKRE